MAWWSIGLFGLYLAAAFLPDGPAFLLYIVAVPLVSAWSLILLIAGVARAWRIRPSPVAALTTALLFPLVAYFLWQPIAQAAVRLHFLTQQPAYERTVSGVRSGAIGRDQAGMSGPHDPAFLIDDGPPARIAFPSSHGMIDNWSAVIHDPTHGVRLARGLGDATPAHLRRLFGDDLVSCWRLRGAYYMCSFT